MCNDKLAVFDVLIYSNNMEFQLCYSINCVAKPIFQLTPTIGYYNIIYWVCLV